MKTQKKLAAKIAKRSKKKVKLDLSRLDDIKEAITRADVRSLLKDKAIQVEQNKGVSRARAKKHQKQKARVRKKGHGSRKGKANARLSNKEKCILGLKYFIPIILSGSSMINVQSLMILGSTTISNQVKEKTN